MTHQDVAVVIAELKKAGELYKTGDVPYYAIEELDSLLERSADLLESQAKALSEAERKAKHLLIAANEYQDRLAEARRVIERLGSSQTFTVPFALDQSSMAGELKARIDAARDFLNAKEKT